MVHYPVCPMDCPLQSKYVLVNHQDDSNMDHIKSFIAELLISKTQFVFCSQTELTELSNMRNMNFGSNPLCWKSTVLCSALWFGALDKCMTALLCPQFTL